MELKLKNNQVGSNILLVGLILHIVYVVVLLLSKAGVISLWQDTKDSFITYAIIAIFIYAASLYFIKKTMMPIAAGVIIVISFFATHFILALVFIVGGSMTLNTALYNANVKRKQNR